MAIKNIIIIPTKQEAQCITNFDYKLMDGIGKAYAVKAVCENRHADNIILMGTCAALDDTDIFTVVVSNKFLEYDMDCTGLGYNRGVTPFSKQINQVIKTDVKLNINFPKRIKIKESGIMSADTFLTEKKIYQESFHFFDMESAAMAKICNEYGIGFVSIKVVTDNANNNSKNDWNENCKRASEILNEIKIN